MSSLEYLSSKDTSHYTTTKCVCKYSAPSTCAETKESSDAATVPEMASPDRGCLHFTTHINQHGQFVPSVKAKLTP